MTITQKQLSGYYKASREWISNNDAYNLEHFGITKDIYYTIQRKMTDTFGPFEKPDHIRLDVLNRQ